MSKKNIRQESLQQDKLKKARYTIHLAGSVGGQVGPLPRGQRAVTRRTTRGKVTLVRWFIDTCFVIRLLTDFMVFGIYIVRADLCSV